MTRKENKKLNHFMVSAPSGVVLTTNWLEEQGVSPKLAWWYVHSGLLERVGMKAYKKAGDKITWVGVVSALQNQLNIDMHVGGKSALQLLGRAHFVPMQERKKIILFANSNIRVPVWVENEKEWNAEFEVFRTSLFRGNDKLLGIIERQIDGVNLKISCPERAAMELLYLLPKYQSLEEAELLIENLGQLRPSIVQSLLERCHSIKVKRVFLFLAEKFQHAWLADINMKKIKLGYGKRMISGGGKYDSKYKLSLPEIEKSELMGE